jgi:hypothetical protein
MKLQDAFAMVAIGIPITTESATDLVRVQDIIDVPTSMTEEEFMADCTTTLIDEFGFDDEQDATTTCTMIKDRMIQDGIRFPGMDKKPKGSDTTATDTASQKEDPALTKEQAAKKKEDAKKKEAAKKK